jgi:hypothetical protein
MDCSCDYEQPEFFVREKHKARLQHCCSECRRTISPGEEYERVRGKWDGDVLTEKRSDTCRRRLPDLACYLNLGALPLQSNERQNL